MTKMQKIWLNILLLVIGYFLSVIVLRMANANNYQNLYAIQLIVLFMIFGTGILLTFLNNQNRKNHIDQKKLFISDVERVRPFMAERAEVVELPPEADPPLAEIQVQYLVRPRRTAKE